MKLRADEACIDTTSAEGRVFDGSFVNDKSLSPEELKTMAELWAGAEDDPDVMDAVIDDELEALENINKEEEEDIGADDSEEEEDEGGDTGLVTRIVSNEEVALALDSVKLFIEQNDLTNKCSQGLNKLERSILRNRLGRLRKNRVSQPSILSFLKK